MSFLYKSRSKPTQSLSHDSDEGIQNVADFFETSNKNKKKRPTAAVEEVNNKKIKLTKAVTLDEEEEDNDDDDNTESKKYAAQQFQQLYQSTGSNVDVIDLDDSSPPQQNSFASADITQKLKSIQEKLAKSRQQASSSIELLDFSPEVQPKVQVRKVMTAQERQKVAEEMARKMNLSSSTSTAAPAKTQAYDSGEDDDSEDRIEIKTRLAGHEKKWKVKPDDKFTKVRRHLPVFNISVISNVVAH